KGRGSGSLRVRRIRGKRAADADGQTTRVAESGGYGQAAAVVQAEAGGGCIEGKVCQGVAAWQGQKLGGWSVHHQVGRRGGDIRSVKAGCGDDQVRATR